MLAISCNHIWCAQRARQALFSANALPAMQHAHIHTHTYIRCNECIHFYDLWSVALLIHTHTHCMYCASVNNNCIIGAHVALSTLLCDVIQLLSTHTYSVRWIQCMRPYLRSHTRSNQYIYLQHCEQIRVSQTCRIWMRNECLIMGCCHYL